MRVAIVLFPGFNDIDAIGPYQVFAHAAGLRTRFVAERRGPVAAGDRSTLDADDGFVDCLDPDMVVVPGGPAARATARAGEPLVEWLRLVHPRASWSASVGAGAMLLEAAGILDRVSATTFDILDTHPGDTEAVTDGTRIAVHDRVITAGSAGPSAGIYLGLALLARLLATPFIPDLDQVRRDSRPWHRLRTATFWACQRSSAQPGRPRHSVAPSHRVRA